jgi:hypothetical protein
MSLGPSRIPQGCSQESLASRHCCQCGNGEDGGRLYGSDIILERLPQDLEDRAAELRPYIQAAHAVARPRHLARQQCRPTPLLVKNAPARPCTGTREQACCHESLVTFFTRRLPLRPAVAPGSWGNPAQVHDGDIRALAGAAGDARDARGLQGPGQGLGQQDGGQPPGQHRLARPWGPGRRT